MDSEIVVTGCEPIESSRGVVETGHSAVIVIFRHPIVA
jgi:hypothetical protein